MVIKSSGLLDTHHVADILACTPKHVRTLIRAKLLPAFKVGKRQYKVAREAVFEYLENNRVDAEKFYE